MCRRDGRKASGSASSFSDSLDQADIVLQFELRLGTGRRLEIDRQVVLGRKDGVCGNVRASAVKDLSGAATMKGTKNEKNKRK